MTYDEKPWLKSYGPAVPKTIEPPMETFVDHFNWVAQRVPDAPAIHFLGKTLSYDRLAGDANRFANALIALGLERGDVVGICMPNTPQYMISVLGALKTGCAVSNVSPLLTAGEMEYQLNDCGAKALVIADMLFEKPFAGAAPKLPGLKTVITTGLADMLPAVKQFLARVLKKIPTGNVTPLAGKQIVRFKEILSRYPATDPGIRPDMDDICFIQYTGGTTGDPKGARLSHGNLISCMAQAEAVMVDTGEDTFCTGLPMFHVAGLVVSLLGPYFGIAQVIIPDPRNTAMILGQIRKYKPTVLVNVPTLYLMFLQDPGVGKVDWSRVRVCYSGAAPFTDEGIRDLEAVVGEGKVRELYGMTETSPLIAMDHLGVTKKVGSVGLPMPSTQIRLLDVVTGAREVALGEEGEVWVCGPQVMQGYHNKPEADAGAFVDHDGRRWLRTGDVGKMDEDGYLFLVDRAKDMIIVGGYKVFSTEVENTLCDHPAVAMCAIVGVRNPDRPETEMVKMVAQRSPDHLHVPEDRLREEITAFARERMAPYKIPRIIEFMDLPLTAVGKIDKKQLRVD
ncbi:MAG: AMP-binding protein [Desulfobacterales bacterium]|nr:AMP-binding protein [Desulfobacterales bacterium]